MGSNKKTLPLIRQFMVTISVTLEVMEHGLVLGFATIILPQLRDDPIMTVDDFSASWIVSILGPSMLIGIMFGHVMVQKFGRRMANLISATTIIIGWIIVFWSTSTVMLLIGRIVQGLALGVTNISSNILVGEYTSPKYRGAFLTLLSYGLVCGGLIVHAVGSFFTWQQTALFCLCIAITDGILIIFSPETPAFLAASGKYDECRKVFHWLRGFDEEYELDKMIRTSEMLKAIEKPPDKAGLFLKAKRKILKIITTVKKLKFYKPMILVTHLDISFVWCGTLMVEIYAVDTAHIVIGKDANTSLLLLAMDITKFIAAAAAIIINAKFKRRSAIKFSYGLHILTLFISAAYCYSKDHQLLSYDHPFIGTSLICLIMLFGTMGPLCTPGVISGEIFPLKYKSLCMMLSAWGVCLNFTICTKLIPYMQKFLTFSGSFCIYGVVVLYATIVALYLLPETKDLVLQDIEEQYWTEPVPDLMTRRDEEELQEFKSLKKTVD